MTFWREQKHTAQCPLVIAPYAGYAVRKDLYNLYHILNHANLFGGGYERQAEGMMQKLLAVAG